MSSNGKPWPQEDIDYLNSALDYCPHCGGEGEVFDCFDGQCIDAEVGCDLCAQNCDYCQ